MGKVSSSFYLALLHAAALSILGTQGLQCYRCTYLNIDGQAVNSSVASCALGSTPNDTLLVNCSSLTYKSAKIFGQGDGDDDHGTIGFRNGVTPKAGPNMTTYGCFTIHGEGTFQGKKRIWTRRSCAVYYNELKTQCKSQTMREWQGGDDVWFDFTYRTFYGFGNEDKVSSCYCAKDNCNSSPLSIIDSAAPTSTTNNSAAPTSTNSAATATASSSFSFLMGAAATLIAFTKQWDF